MIVKSIGSSPTSKSQKDSRFVIPAPDAKQKCHPQAGTPGDPRRTLSKSPDAGGAGIDTDSQCQSGLDMPGETQQPDSEN